MNFYDRLTMEQVGSTYKLVNFLKRLRVIGDLKAHTEGISGLQLHADDPYFFTDFSGRDYCIVKDGYSPERTKMDETELLEKIFGRVKVFQYRGTY